MNESSFLCGGHQRNCAPNIPVKNWGPNNVYSVVPLVCQNYSFGLALHQHVLLIYVPHGRDIFLLPKSHISVYASLMAFGTSLLYGSLYAPVSSL